MALTRFGLPQEFTRVIDSIYTQPNFQVRAMNHTGPTATAKSGIRQGCPLSPYLFLVVHSAIMHDVEAQLTQHGTNAQPWLHSQNRPLWDLAYADDTVVLTRTAERCQEILHLIQPTAAQ